VKNERKSKFTVSRIFQPQEKKVYSIKKEMKWSATTLAAAIFVVTSSSSSTTEAFTPINKSIHSSSSSYRNNQSKFTSKDIAVLLHLNTLHNNSIRSSSSSRRSHTQLKMSTATTYSVGIVGATGAVGKEIRNCLETRNFPISTLRIFGSERSAGTKIETDKYGTITVELFHVNTAKQCDVVFLAVNGEFSLQYARALSDGNDGCIVIDNSVRNFYFVTFVLFFTHLSYRRIKIV
jgi:Semialdehyde dehydrogenase, NAD binding domain